MSRKDSCMHFFPHSICSMRNRLISVSTKGKCKYTRGCFGIHGITKTNAKGNQTNKRGKRKLYTMVYALNYLRPVARKLRWISLNVEKYAEPFLEENGKVLRMSSSKKTTHRLYSGFDALRALSRLCIKITGIQTFARWPCANSNKFCYAWLFVRKLVDIMRFNAF